MSKTKTKTNGKRGKQQTEIIGTERPVIAEIDEHASVWCEQYYSSQELLKASRDTKPLVADAMERNKLEVYKFDDGEYEYTFRFAQGEPKLQCERQRIEE